MATPQTYTWGQMINTSPLHNARSIHNHESHRSVLILDFFQREPLQADELGDANIVTPGPIKVVRGDWTIAGSVGLRDPSALCKRIKSAEETTIWTSTRSSRFKAGNLGCQYGVWLCLNRAQY
ncbi:hypothetical protein CLCR_02674 [Cladophialophora carrionii]|uniref:Uncharacterized protein n=1 Tax=Cladophialophora carrionii TaxID=86049 RepID=A0A1C1CFH0_9EURO|nr:hypothetical protein CLCR_02674 [Cladophialophora carrionii]